MGNADFKAPITVPIQFLAISLVHSSLVRSSIRNDRLGHLSRSVFNLVRSWPIHNNRVGYRNRICLLFT